MVFAVTEISVKLQGRDSALCSVGMSGDKDCPAITLTSHAKVRGLSGIHRVRDQFIFMDTLCARLDGLGVSKVSVYAFFNLVGCDFVPFTYGNPQRMLLRALFQWRVTHNSWREIEDEAATGYWAVDSLLSLLALAYVEQYRPAFKPAEKYLQHDNQTLSSSNVLEFCKKVRYAVWDTGLKTASQSMAKTSDCILNRKCSKSALRHWMGAFFIASWNRDVIECASEAFGFITDGAGDSLPFFESASGALYRVALLKRPFTTCGCANCNRSSCPCRRIGRFCLPGLCKQRISACENSESSHVSSAIAFREVCTEIATVASSGNNFVDSQTAHGAASKVPYNIFALCNPSERQGDAEVASAGS